MIQPVKIGNHLVGPGQPCFIIAEAGVNHNGDINLAHQLIEASMKAGADAIKFQSFITEELITPDAPKADYQVKTTGKSDSQYEMLKSLELSIEQQVELKERCTDTGITYLCTPYENTSVDVLDGMNIAAFKIASTDTTNTPFLHYVASKGRPILISTGMSSLGEVEYALEALYAGGLKKDIVILHCTSEYPSPVNEANLRAIQTMQQAFCLPIGFSDHTSGIGVGAWAVAIGACVLEKHFTLDRNMVGPDHQASLDPNELAALVKTVRDVEAALGNGIKRPMPSELPNKSRMQKSLVAQRNICAGDVIASDDLACKRPGIGLNPLWYDRVVGKRAAIDIPLNGILTLASVDWSKSQT